MAGRLRLAITATLATIALTVSMVPAVGASDSSGWIYFDQSASPFVFLTSHTIALQGSRGSDGRCEGLLTLDHAAGAPPVTAVEVAANPNTCQQLIQIGTTDPAAPALPSSGGQRSASLSAAGHGNASPLTVRQKHGYFYAYYHDPVGIVVNSVEDEMTWNYNTPFITQVVAAWDNITWFSVPRDQWYPTSHTGPVLTVDYNDYWARVSSTASFYNTDFCGGTGTSYQPNLFEAYGDGHDSGSVNPWAWGCDSNLLSLATTLY